MEIKKSKNANLESKRLLFFQLGIIATLSLSLIAFEWRTNQITILDEEDPWVEIPLEDPIDITYRKAKPLPPPPAQLKKNVDILIVVKNDTPIVDPIVDKKEEPKTPDIVTIDEPGEKAETVPFILVQHKPVFPGCEGLSETESLKCFQKGIMKHVRDEVKYPNEARKMGIQGKVFVSFVINTEGLVADVKIARGVDRLLDAEALRVIKTLPQMTPAMQRDKPVAIMYSVPIGFAISR